MAAPDEAGERSSSLASKTREEIIEAELSWISSLVVFYSTVYNVLQLDLLWVAFGIAAITLYILPIISARDPFRSLPWEITLLMAAPVLLHISAGSRTMSEHFAWWDDVTSLAFAFSLSTLGFLLTVELEMFSTVRMNRPFAVFFVVMFTLAIAGFWQVGEFFGDVIWGTNYQGTNRDVMKSLTWNMVGGIIMGFVYAIYMRVLSERRARPFGQVHMWEVARRPRD